MGDTIRWTTTRDGVQRSHVGTVMRKWTKSLMTEYQSAEGGHIGVDFGAGQNYGTITLLHRRDDDTLLGYKDLQELVKQNDKTTR
jgi:hypothetical protein